MKPTMLIMGPFPSYSFWSRPCATSACLSTSPRVLAMQEGEEGASSIYAHNHHHPGMWIGWSQKIEKGTEVRRRKLYYKSICQGCRLLNSPTLPKDFCQSCFPPTFTPLKSISSQLPFPSVSNYVCDNGWLPL